ncbi:MAG: dihydrofolate reductase family protein [Planctomycetota bacterium]|nr:dihydrofolate reductase family protein [Planctomycetota bacterium]
MGKITFGVANSLENRLARADDTADWLLWSDEVKAAIEDFWKKVDAVLMGRKTWEAISKMDAPLQSGVKTYLFSRSLKKSPDESVELVSTDAARFVRTLKSQDGKDICCMGGGDFARSLFEADLIDELSLNIHPLLLGSGPPLFPELSRQIDLKLVECRTLEHGCVSVTYRIKN